MTESFRGQEIFREFIGYDYFSLPANEEEIPGMAEVAWAEAGGNPVRYQMVRAQYHVAGEWVRGEISTEKFERDFDNIVSARRLYDKH